MSRSAVVDLGTALKVLGLGSFIRNAAGSFCKCGNFNSDPSHALCPICRAGGQSGSPVPTTVPKKPVTATTAIEKKK